MFDIKLLNKISDSGLSQFNRSLYRISDDIEDPDAIIVRSSDMHSYDFNPSLKAIARAGIGVNNIPIDECSKHGIVVFNTPGANANAVKELVIAALFLSSRKVIDGIIWTKGLAGNGDKIEEMAEKGKSNFSGPEISGKKLGVIGLGAIGVQVANTAHSLGMEVYGYDPYLSVDSAWGLSRSIIKADSIKTIYQECDYITLHVPFTKETKNMLNADAFSIMNRGMRIINFSRSELVNLDDMEQAIENGYVARYITDFPSEKALSLKKTIVIPHLGASTPESEENCAIMAVSEISDFLENGIIRNSVNFPTMATRRVCKIRICLLHYNKPNMLSQISSILAKENINIEHLYNSSKKDYAATFVDTDQPVSDNVVALLKGIDGMINVRRVR